MLKVAYLPLHEQRVNGRTFDLLQARAEMWWSPFFRALVKM
jgi:hypothetical protein